MRILENDIYRDMTEDEIAELKKNQQFYNDESKDNLTALAEGLSTANNMKDVQEAAKKYIRKRGKINERQNSKALVS